MMHIYGFLKNKNINNFISTIKSSIHDYQYDWTSGEVAWECDINEINIFNDHDDHDDDRNNNNNNNELKYDKINYNTNNIIETELIEIKSIKSIKSINTNIIVHPNFENKIIWKAIISGIMKGIYVQIITIDNIIAYMQCYSDKVVEFDIIVSILYIIFYEKNKSIEKKNIIALKNYNNMYLFEKYIKLRRNASIIVVVIYILLFRGISNVE
jgi:hypothetical protein